MFFRLNSQANKALRTLCLAHMDYSSPAELPEGYELDSPDAETMVLDAIVGIQDPLRGDVKDAVETAQRAGVMVSSQVSSTEDLHKRKRKF